MISFSCLRVKSIIGITANQDHSLQDKLQKKFPNYFQGKKSSYFLVSKSKSPSISLKESLTVKEKALFIKTYHDLVIEKYQEIKSTKKEEPLEKAEKEKDEKEKDEKEKAEKEKNFLEELKKLDKEVMKLLDEDPEKLNEELYKLSSDSYPQATIFSRNALASRKKSISIDDKPSSKAMSGEELFKFYLLSDLIEQQIKIDKLEKSKNDQEGQLAPNEKNISLKQAKEDLENARENLENARENLENARKKLKQAEEDLEKAKEDLEEAQKKVARKYALHRELSALEEIKGNLEEKKITKANIISTINYLHEQKDFQFSAEDLKIFSDSYRRYKDPAKQNPLLLIKKICDGSKTITQQSESLNPTLDSNENPKLNANFIALIDQELLKELLKNFMKFSKAKGHSKAKFEKSYREDLVAFLKACPTEKERLDVITSFALKLGIPEKNLKVGFYRICANDANAELRDFKSSNITDDRYEKLQAKIDDYLFKIKEIDPNFKMGPKESSTNIKSSKPPTPKVKQPKQPPTTITSLFLGFVPNTYSKFIPSEIKYLIRTPVKFSVRLFDEVQKPDTDTNIFQAVQMVLSNFNKSPPTK